MGRPWPALAHPGVPSERAEGELVRAAAFGRARQVEETAKGAKIFKVSRASPSPPHPPTPTRTRMFSWTHFTDGPAAGQSRKQVDSWVALRTKGPPHPPTLTPCRGDPE